MVQGLNNKVKLSKEFCIQIENFNNNKTSSKLKNLYFEVFLKLNKLNLKMFILKLKLLKIINV